MPARYVKPYVKRNKNDAADAEAICEAVTRPTMRFVAVKTPEQQSVLMLHRTRQLVRAPAHHADQRDPRSHGGVRHCRLVSAAMVLRNCWGSSPEGEDERIPPAARECLMALAAQLELVKRQILEADRRVLAWHRASKTLASVLKPSPVWVR